MKTFEKLAELALGSRLMRLSDMMMKDVSQIYQEFGFKFESKWFTVFYLLSEKDALSIMEIAEDLEISHPAVIQIAKELEKEGLIQSKKSEHDHRKRFLSLTQKGKDLRPHLHELWTAFSQTNLQLLHSQRNHLLFAIEEMEKLLTEKSFYNRIMETIKKQQAEAVLLVDYNPSMKENFKALNVAWITKYFALETHDLEQLEQPEKYILEDGGKIFFAKIQDTVVGTCALIKVNDDLFELAKMAVSEEYQGRQIGKKLCQYAVEQARAMGAKQIFLESNTKLIPAISLYQKIGFFKVELSTSPFQRANIKMMLNLI